MCFSHFNNQSIKSLIILGILSSLILTLIVSQQKISQAAIDDPALLFSPKYVSGTFGYNDQRDADVYPAVSFDDVTGRYLAVWMTPRNAGSSSDGFDVYGIFLGLSGQPTGNSFRISDSKTVARNGIPAIVAGNGEFAVAWAMRGSSCKVYVQRVTDSSSRSDRLLVSGTGHFHSPNLAYNSVRQRYLLAYVKGDDYLPPTFLGAETDDCGNNVSSNSSLEAVEFYFQDDSPIIGNSLTISDTSGGAFRPQIAYSKSLNQYLIVWENRSNVTGDYEFNVSAQLVNGNATLMGNDISLAIGGDYSNYDTTATWTPRPVVAGSNTHFLIAWFTRETQGTAVIWSVTGRFMSSKGTLDTPFTIAKMTFGQSHDGQSPTGFLSIAFGDSIQEYLVGLSTYMESVWGYLSFALVQRVNTNGQLLKLNGSIQSEPGVGYSIDTVLDDRIGIGVAAHSYSLPIANYIVVYSKHAPSRSSQDFDIWNAQIRIQSADLFNTYLPLVTR